MPDESEIISRIRKRARTGDDVLFGIGDDGAVIKTTGGKDVIACCDLMIEGIHFRTEWTPPRLLGRKALAVNLSDIAAMGGVPRFAMMSIAFPPECSSEFIDELLDGLFELADANRVSIVGGDTSSSRDSLFIDLSVIGDCQSGKAVTRRGATAGDHIYVSGSLGASALGLSLLETGFRLHETRDERDLKMQAVLKHLRPEPQLRLGWSLSEQGLATSMIDISDGLSTDLSHILDESGVGGIIYSSALPIAGCVRSLARHDSRINPATLALHGGEEYELLFTASKQNHQRVLALAETTDAPITLIGEIVAQKELGLERNGRIEPLRPLGYQHHI